MFAIHRKRGMRCVCVCVGVCARVGDGWVGKSSVSYKGAQLALCIIIGIFVITHLLNVTMVNP